MSRSGCTDQHLYHLVFGWIAAALALPLAACGDGLVDDQYAGEPLIEVSGQVRSEIAQDFPEEALHLAILWEVHKPGDFSYQPELTVRTTFPARYTLSLYEIPPDEVWVEAMEGGRFALGAVVLYLDTDGDVRMDPGEPMLGGTEDVVVYYNDAAYSFGDTTLTAGFHTLQFTNGCPDNGPTIKIDAKSVDLYLSDTDGYVPLVGCLPPP